MKLAIAALLITLASATAWAQVNVGEQKPEASLPFTMTTVNTFELPWRIAFLPDGRMLITEKVGPVWLVSPQGQKIAPVANTPPVYWQGQNGMLGVFLSPHYASDQSIYLTYAEPGDYGGGLALARGKLTLTATSARLENFEVLWHQMPKGKGGQEGAQIAFSPDGQSLFLTVGDRQRFTPAQDPNQPEGKILRLTLDGKPAPGNPHFGETGAATIPLIDPPKDTEAAKTAPVVSTYTFPGPNLTPAETWTSGHRTPYGMAFSPSGELWEVEHGPRGGDELNLIEMGRNYGWPVVSFGQNYDGVPIPNPNTQPDPNWLPLPTKTAPDPSYPGAHSAISFAGAEVLKSELGDRFTFDVTSESLQGVKRHFTSFSAAAEEAGLSRIYAGQHFRTDHIAGQGLGGKVAESIVDTILLPR